MKIHYRYHPVHAREVEVIRRHPTDRGLDLVIALPDGTRCMVPAWMTDPVVCAAYRNSVEPRVALHALRALRGLVDAQAHWAMMPSQRTGWGRSGGGDEEEAREPALDGWWSPSRDHLPADVAEEGRKLIAQLLRMVVETERDEEGGDGEREDHFTSS